MKRALFGIFALAAFSAAADGSVSAYLASPAEFSAQSGETNAIAQLSIKGQSPSISVTSGGQIAVGRFDTLDAYGSAFTDSPVSVSVSGGGFAVAAPLEKQENAAVESALAKAAMHLDASDGDSFVFDGDGKIERWKDVRTEGGIDAVAGTVDGTYVFSRPTLAEDAINGMDAVDFGLRSGDGFSSDDAAFMSFEGGFFSNGFMVMREKTAGSGAFYLGGVGDWWYYQFHRGGLPLIGWDDAQTANAINAMWRVDGRQVGPLEYYIDGDFHVVSFAGAGSFANTLCNDRGSRAGGWQFAEVILFTEALNEDEHRAIESMLMAKWLDAPHPAETAKTAKIDTLSFGSGVDAIVDADAGMSVTSLSGEGVLVKRGGGAVSVSSLSGISSVSVEEGELSLASSFSGLLDSAFFHVDASAADTVVTDGDGHVLRVDDAGGNGRYAYVSPNVNWGAYPSVATV
ncbi:MAG: hypothetical protein ILO34_00870, partial [Kiritimatiellae bacterium]|nr:hypothetical protein [Kiritimatiellia bacterium]